MRALHYATIWLHNDFVSMGAVFKALADPARRRLLDSLRARNGQTLGQLCKGHNMTRQAVTKHLVILEKANLVTTQRSGREKLHYLNPVPIQEISDRWISKYERSRLRVLTDLKRTLENKNEEKT
jgi:DNA-binding transcriptional ArsR family regulator